MKKAKIALTILSLFSIIAGALAYKVNTTRLFYSTGPQGNCDAILFTKLAVTTNLFFGAFTTLLSTTKDNQNPCPGMSVRTIS
ncbi:hypothetical protein [Chitinophaga sp. RAB17]|uniref:hypothetical protein n=1 Tax=Chitinophaga sp. RAB17 TaxID=3233049 RepID=UPI003F92BA40